MKVAVIIPTLSRYDSLIQTIESIEKSNYKKISTYVVIDGNHNLWKKMTKYYLNTGKKIGLVYNDKRRGWGNSINDMFQVLDGMFDYYFCASDDLDFQFDTISRAVKAMTRYFPDGDGVIGINQPNLSHFCPGAIVLVGEKFITRFPDRQLYFPLYRHFCVDSELWHYAVTKKKFYFCEQAKVFHNRFDDRCHRLAQSTLKWDRVLWWMKKGRPTRYWPNFVDLDYWRKQMQEKEKNIKYWYSQKQHLLGKGGVT